MSCEQQLVAVTAHISSTGTELPPSCPTCGKRMQWWPALDGGSYIAVCPDCPPTPESLLAEPPTPSTRLDSLTRPARRPPAPQRDDTPLAPSGPERFRRLIAQAPQPPAEPVWPEALLEDLPEDARRLLAGRKPETPAGPGQTARLREELVSILKSQGYTIQEDVHGVRISGHPTGRLRGTDRLSASDVVRMAADLDGGIPPPDKVRRCPKCDAVIPIESKRCQWCGHVL